MAPRAVGWRIQVFLRYDLAADFARVAIGNPIELRNQLGRPNVGSRVAVALQAHGHVERLLLADLYHLVDPAVAAHAAYACCDVRAVVKIDVVGQDVDLLPWNGFAGFVRLPDHLEARALVL